MDKNNYGNVLRNLLSFSNTKFLILGNHLGYDVSYISKWCSGTKLPATKSIGEINKQIASLIGKEIIDMKKTTVFFNEFKIEVPKKKEFIEDKKFLEDRIYDLLKLSYDNSSDDIEEKENMFFIEPESIRNALEENIKNEIIGSNEEINVYISTDLNTPESIFILSLLSKLKPENININVSIAISLNELKDEKYNYLKTVFFLLNKFVNLNIELYNIKEVKNLNSIVIKNKISFIYSMNNEGHFETVVFTKDKSKVLKSYNTIVKCMNLDNKILTFKNSESLVKKAFRTNFYSGDNFNFLIVDGFEFFLPPTIIKNIMQYAEKDGYSSSDIVNMKKLMVTWKEMFEKSNINFFVLKSSILKYFQERRIFFMNVEYEMSLAEIKEHYSYFINIIQKNSKINFYVIDDYKMDMDYLEFRVSLCCNENNVFLKNLYNLHKKQEDFFSVINNSSMIRDINFIFNELKKSTLCKKYSVEEIEASWEKHKNLIFQIIEIDEN